MEKNIISIIHQHLPYLNPALRKIAEYILENMEESRSITTRNLAGNVGVAESTVTRFVNELGFGSFQELKMSIVEYLTQNQMAHTEEDKVYEDIAQGDGINDVIEKLVYRNTLALTETRRTLNNQAVQQAVDLIDAAETLVLCSAGFSRVAAAEGVMRFIRAGKKCITFDDESTQLIVSSICGPKDVMIGISNTGRTKKVIQAMRNAQAGKCPTIGITSFEDSPIVRHSDVLLFTPSKSKAAETGTTWESASSKTAQILVMDILCACYTLRHYNETLEHMNDTYQALKETRENRR